MVEIIDWLNDSKYIKPLSPACNMCSKGSKMVLFITGFCFFDCFYCPLSFEKGGKDRIFVDEWELIDENDIDKIIQEAKYIKAKGAGITGGDPLLVYDRTKRYISLLKDEFGSNFNIHLYTKALKNNQYIDDFISEGLDEIRFHPSMKYWNKMDKSPISKIIRDTINKDIDVAIEIPSIPEMKDEILSLIKWSNDNYINWININELEISERNVKKFLERNFKNKNDFSSTIDGSENIAYDILKIISECDYEIGIHYCSCSFKEGVQLTNRLKRRAKSIVKKHEFISNEGTLIKGVIYPNKNLSLESLYKKLINDFKIKDKKIFINFDKKRIEMRILELNSISSKLLDQGLFSYLIEEYPTADGLEVEKIPLPI
jgi:hypothetical protein